MGWCVTRLRRGDVDIVVDCRDVTVSVVFAQLVGRVTRLRHETYPSSWQMLVVLVYMPFGTGMSVSVNRVELPVWQSVFTAELNGFVIVQLKNLS